MVNNYFRKAGAPCWKTEWKNATALKKSVKDVPYAKPAGNIMNRKMGCHSVRERLRNKRSLLFEHNGGSIEEGLQVELPHVGAFHDVRIVAAVTLRGLMQQGLVRRACYDLL